MNLTYNHLQLNLIAEAVRRETRAGIDYLVAPAVVLVEGVLNGSLVLAEEFGAFVDAWNDVPLPVHHPEANGHAISARSLEVQDAWVIGRFYNARLDGPRLKGEFWIDIAKAKRLGGEAARVVAMLEAGEPVEVSTGYFCELELVEGEWQGEPYTSIQRDLRPDHVALLPGAVGACSWRDGCGVPRVNQQETHMTRRVLVTLELSLDERLRRIYEAWDTQVGARQPPGDVWYVILEIFDDRLIVSGDRRLWSYPYTISEGGQVTFGEPVEVQRAYEPVTDDIATNDGGDAVDQEFIAQPTGNGESETDEPMALTMEELQAQAAEDARQEQPEDAAAAQPEPVGNEPDADAPAEPMDAVEPVEPPEAAEPEDDVIAEAAAAFRQIIESVGAENFRAVIAGLAQNARQEREALVAEIVANSAGQFVAEDLQGIKLELLRKMRRAVAPQVNTGRAAGRTAAGTANQEPQTLEMPSMWA